MPLPDGSPRPKRLTPDEARRIQRVFALQQANAPFVRATSVRQRVHILERFREAVVDWRERIQEAVYLDFGRAPIETDLVEIVPVLVQLKHAIDQVGRWMQPQRIPRPWLFLGTRAEIRYEPKGTVLIIGPWNYPFLLTVGPLVSALAAGNTVCLKPSELTPHTARLLVEFVEGLFPENEVAVFEGDATVAVELQKRPFDHVFLTGSPDVGREVMRAAAAHLASTTLELGGKSPVVVDETAELKSAAAKILLGKTINAGQTCIAPDYVLVQDDVHDALLEAIVARYERAYTGDRAEATPSLPRIVNLSNYRRLDTLFTSTLAAGAEVELGGTRDADTRQVEFTLLTNVEPDHPIMREEIFGPFLPILRYDTLDDALAVINRLPNPLTLYVFSRDDATIETLLNRTTAGTTLINDTLIQFAHPNLPFGGSKTSGMGRAHGRAGFLEFSNPRSVLYQTFNRTPFRWTYPPYSKLDRRILEWLIRHLSK